MNITASLHPPSSFLLLCKEQLKITCRTLSLGLVFFLFCFGLVLFVCFGFFWGGGVFLDGKSK